MHRYYLGLLLMGAACAHARPNDVNGWRAPVARAPAYDGMVKTSQYVTMRDGTQIAVTYYLPEGLPAGQRVPTILRMTRYWRDWQFRFPFSLFLSDNINGPTRERFVTAGYAWIDVDVRGSGVSSGHQTCSWCPDEVQDGAQVVDWIVAQSWSNGKVGAMGISYDGTASEMLVLNHHPAVKAIAPRFALYDTYTDVAFPGGIHLARFTERWRDFNRAQDRMAVHETLGFGAGLAIVGPRPVDTDEDGAQLAAAAKAHLQNHDVHAEALHLTFRDDYAPHDPYRNQAYSVLATAPTSLSGSIGVFSPHTYREALETSGVPVFSYSGWWDGAYQHAAIKRFLTIRTPGSRLILGPWDHGGLQHIEPFAGSRTHAFDHDGELMRFFDRYLRDDAPADSAPAPLVAYYTMGEGKWKTAESWPPAAESVTFYAAPARALAAAAASGTDSYEVDSSVGTGEHGRWFALLNLRGATIGYDLRNDLDATLPSFTSAPLEGDMEVTGHPLVTLKVASSSDDGFFFAYLEDVSPEGDAALVTEGWLRALDRKLSAAPPPYRTPTPYRTFLAADAQKLVPGEPAELVFDLLPTSYLFRKGHQVRLTFAGADRDTFAVYPGDPAHWTIALDGTHVVLPVVRTVKP